jgi:hypothetical protein
MIKVSRSCTCENKIEVFRSNAVYIRAILKGTVVRRGAFYFDFYVINIAQKFSFASNIVIAFPFISTLSQINFTFSCPDLLDS